MAKTKKNKVALGVGLGLAAAAGAAAGYYFYGSKNAAGNRKQAVRWVKHLEADVLREAKKIKKLDERAYHAVVNEAMKAYKNVKSIDKKDLASAAGELKRNWRVVEREMARVGKKEGKVALKAGKKAFKQVKRVIPRRLKKKSAKKKQ